MTDTAEILDLLSRLQIKLAAFPAEDYYQLIELGDYHVRVCQYFIADLRSQAYVLQDLVTLQATSIPEEIRLFQAVQSEVQELIDVRDIEFWHTENSAADPQVRSDTPSHRLTKH